MNGITLPMALVDFIPVGLFVASAVVLQRDLYNKMSKGSFALLAAGTIMIIMAGFYKALWKLLYALGICDFVALNSLFFPLQTTGFVITAIALIALLTANQGKNTLYSAGAVPVAYTSSMIFVILTVLGTLGICGCLAIIAARMKKKGAIAIFVLAFVFMMAMGYLSSRDFTQGSMHWVAQGTNIIGQGTLLLGIMKLHNGGLKAADAIKKG